VLTHQTGKFSSGFVPMQGRAAPHCSYLEQQSRKLLLSALKLSEHGRELVLRFWNPSSSAATEKLRFWRPVVSAAAVNLAETDADPDPAIEADGDCLKVTAGPRKIVTLRVDLGPAA
jgi:alpha-mannosidase